VGQQSWVLVTSDEHDARQLAEDVKASVATHRLGPEFQFVYRSSAPDFRAIVARTIARQPASVVMLGTSGDSAAFVRLLRSEEYGGPVVGGPWMGRSQFLEQAGAAAEGVVFPLLAARCQLEPKVVSAGQSATVPADADSWDYAACLTYDAVRLVIEAIRRGGLNRDRIRTTIHSLQPWAGISGTVRWDPLGSNMREIQLATVKNGRIRPLSDTACDLP
jgi:branched-chain amino acid transport system substrate-binding protein